MATEEHTRHPLVKKANAASSAELQRSVSTLQTVKNQSYRFKLLHSSEVTDDLRRQIWNIFEHNMRSIYEKSVNFGWNPKEKQEEMFHSLSRFLLVHPGEGSGDRVPRRILSYSIFRFEREDKRNIVYCYELQASPDAQRLGLGRAMIDNLHRIGKAFRMGAIMLTSFIANERGQAFYDSLGFKVDRTSPDFEDDEWVDDDGDSETEQEDHIVFDYRILSKPIDK